jgi:hypothetical protein
MRGSKRVFFQNNQERMRANMQERMRANMQERMRANMQKYPIGNNKRKNLKGLRRGAKIGSTLVNSNQTSL